MLQHTEERLEEPFSPLLPLLYFFTTDSVRWMTFVVFFRGIITGDRHTPGKLRVNTRFSLRLLAPESPPFAAFGTNCFGLFKRFIQSLYRLLGNSYPVLLLWRSNVS